MGGGLEEDLRVDEDSGMTINRTFVITKDITAKEQKELESLLDSGYRLVNAIQAPDCTLALLVKVIEESPLIPKTP